MPHFRIHGFVLHSSLVAVCVSAVAAICFGQLDGLAAESSAPREQIEAAMRAGDIDSIPQLAARIAEHDGPKSIPLLIGVIDADNSYETVYKVGYFVLRPLTTVDYSPLHDGAWWRRWWEANKQKFPADMQAVPIPDLPKTKFGKSYSPFGPEAETLEGQYRLAAELLATGKGASGAMLPNSTVALQDLAEAMAEHDDASAIPLLIGLLDADNSLSTVSAVGRALSDLTGVERSSFHDGPWWRRWWDANKTEFAAEDTARAIPELPKTPFGRKYQPYREDIDTLQGKLRLAAAMMQARAERPKGARDLSDVLIWNLATEIARHEDPHAIPYLIGMIAADNTYDTVYGVGYFGLGIGSKPLTDVSYDESHDGAWWKDWWEDNKANFPADVQAIEIPDFKQPLTFDWKELTEDQKKENARAAMEEAMADVADVPALDLTVDGHERMRYFLVGPQAATAPPREGYKLVVVMPGGDGSADFHPFVRRIFQNAMNEEYVVAQLVAVRWTPRQQVIWPTSIDRVKKQQFSTEQFVEAVIGDVGRRLPLDRRHIFTLSWSSSGPAAYAIALQDKTAVTGSFIAMSVYRREWCPPLEHARGRAFYLLHSPEDKICKFTLAEQAEKELRETGANVEFAAYEGGHGWHGAVYRQIRNGLEWLVAETTQSAE